MYVCNIESVVHTISELCQFYYFQGLAAKLNLGAVVLNLHQYVAQITGRLPSEIVFPLALVSAGFGVSTLASSVHA